MKKSSLPFDKKEFETPPLSSRVRPMTHSVPENSGDFWDNYLANGYGGAVVNVPFDNGFTENPENMAHFAKILDDMDARGLSYWIYDEPGYPSGQAGGRTLAGHPEYQMKGIYMHRRAAYEDTSVNFRLDDESEKIVFAAIYPFDTPGKHESFVRFSEMRPVHFSKKTVKCELHPCEVLYIFCVRNAHEGTQSTHNTWSFRRNINLMSPAAVRRFLDAAYEPVASAIPDAYKRAGYVFTDEPSLMVRYVRDYESYNYAMLPWVDGFFRKYEKKYGEQLLPDLPLLFEGCTSEDADGLHNRAYAVRIKYWSLVSDLCSEAYTGQITKWCEAHGGGFSGHYLAEELISKHVFTYGNYIKMLSRASYPGLDILDCRAGHYNPNTAKFTQTAARKRGTNGTMVEMCPFVCKEEFRLEPTDNIVALVGMLALDGVRVFNSYYQPFDPTPTDDAGREAMKNSPAVIMNETVGRLNVLLTGKHNDCRTLLYYPIEDAQAKAKPCYTISENAIDTDANLGSAVNGLFSRGLDFYYADADDIVLAAKKAEKGKPSLYGIPVERVLIPKMTVIHARTLEALHKLLSRGVRVAFIDAPAPMLAEDASPAGQLTSGIPVSSIGEIAEEMLAEDRTVYSEKPVSDGTLHFGRYLTDEGRYYLAVNIGTYDHMIRVEAENATLLWVVNGEIKQLGNEKSFVLPKKRPVVIFIPNK